MRSDPDEQTLKAIASLMELGDTELLLQWLDKERGKLLESTEECVDEIVLRRHQGASIFIKQLVNLFKTAREKLAEKRVLREKQRK